jgi:hypothetical protein
MPKITELDAGTAATGAEKFPAVQSGSTVRLLLSQVLTYIAAATKTLTNTTFDTAGTGNSLSINGLAATANTGTGAVVRATSPTLVTPALGTPSSVTLTNATGLPVATGIADLGAGVATFLATPSSGNLAGAVTNETGSGALVFATSPTLVTPILGTPTSGTLTNCTGLPATTGIAGLGSGVANWLSTPSSSFLATAMTDETGSGSLVFATSPSLTTPVIAGITSGTPPAAGKVGEIISATVSIASAFALTSGSAGQVWNSISLTAGIWLVGGTAGVIKLTSTPTFTHMHADHQASPASTITTSPGSGATVACHITSNQENGWIFPMGLKPYNISATTTINAIMTADFTGGTAGAYGHLFGVRIA